MRTHEATLLMIAALAVILTGCTIKNAGDPRHTPPAFGMPGSNIERHMPWLQDFDAISATKYDKDTNNCKHKAIELGRLAIIKGHPAQYVSIRLPKGTLHAVLHISNPRINNGYLVDPTHKEIIYCPVGNEKHIKQALKHYKWGTFNTFRNERLKGGE